MDVHSLLVLIHQSHSTKYMAQLHSRSVLSLSTLFVDLLTFGAGLVSLHHNHRRLSRNGGIETVDRMGLLAGYGKYSDPGGGWSYAAYPLPALDTYTRHTVPAQYLYALIHHTVGELGWRLLTPTVVYLELGAVPLALVAIYAGVNFQWLLKLIICAMWTLHVGIALTLRNAALLSLVACTAWIPLWPSSQQLPSTDKTHKQQTTQEPYPTRQSCIERSSHQWWQFGVSLVAIGALLGGNIWFETTGCVSAASLTKVEDKTRRRRSSIWSTILHNRWNVFVGAEEYVTWEIAPGLLADGFIVDVWGRHDFVDWNIPSAGAPSTAATSRPGRWRSFPYLAELQGRDAIALWGYLCHEWDQHQSLPANPGRKLVRFQFFMLQADVLPAMTFSATRKRLIQSFDCIAMSIDNGKRGEE